MRFTMLFICLMFATCFAQRSEVFTIKWTQLEQGSNHASECVVIKDSATYDRYLRGLAIIPEWVRPGGIIYKPDFSKVNILVQVYMQYYRFHNQKLIYLQRRGSVYYPGIQYDSLPQGTYNNFGYRFQIVEIWPNYGTLYPIFIKSAAMAKPPAPTGLIQNKSPENKTLQYNARGQSLKSLPSGSRLIRNITFTKGQ